MKEKILLPIFIVLIAALMRIVPHIPNIAPIGGMAIFGGMYLDKKYALIVPLAALFLSDIFIGFHDVMFFVYVSFIISVFLGMWAARNRSAGKTIIAILSSSFIFFILTNFGVWFVSGMYEKTPKGLLECFILALPFFRNTILGDLLYSSVFILLYEMITAFLRKYATISITRKK